MAGTLTQRKEEVRNHRACSLKKNNSAQKVKFSITDFFSKCDQIRSKLRVWSHLLKKSAMQNSIFCTVSNTVLIYENICSVIENYTKAMFL